MGKNFNQRIKYLKIIEILKNESDENNPLTTSELLRKLEKDNIIIDRKTLYSDIKVLNKLGYEVICERGRSNSYFIYDRKFEISELSILIDAVQSASFITEKKTKELVNKISELNSVYCKSILCAESRPKNHLKHTNESIYYNINEIKYAIFHKKDVSFYYFNLNIKGDRKYKREKSLYVVSPIATFLNENNYYLVAYYKIYNKICNFRIDRMVSVSETDILISDNDMIRNFNLEKHICETFSVFTGEEKCVKIEFDKSLLNVIYDKYGEKTKIIDNGEKCIIDVTVQISPMFIGWCCSFDDKIKVLSPNDVKETILKQINEIVNNYK